MIGTKIINKANTFLAKYENKSKASMAAAYEAIGGLIMLDAVFGMPHPLSGRKRSSILGTLTGILVGIAFLFAPTLYNHSAQAKMTSQTTGTVVSISAPVTNTTTDKNGTHTTTTCTLVAKYNVGGKDYNGTTASGTNSNCSQVAGNTINLYYNPNNPTSIDTSIGTLKTVVKIFFWVGVVIIITGTISFLFRLFAIWFGWKLFRRGRSIAKTLPNGGNLASMISSIKDEFKKNVFNV